jgi:S1-C subfamily serine protease
VTPQLASANRLAVDYGVLIARFTTDAAGKSPAQAAGLRQGDIIVAVNATAIAGNGDLAGALLTLEPGTRVELTIQRGAAQQYVTATLGERPANFGG